MIFEPRPTPQYKSAEAMKAEVFRVLEEDTGAAVRKIFGDRANKVAAAHAALNWTDAILADGNPSLAFDFAREFADQILDKKDVRKLPLLEKMVEICMNDGRDRKAYNLLTEAVELASIHNRTEDASRFSSMAAHLEIV